MSFLCRLDSPFFVIFFRIFVVSTESMTPIITFLAPHCSSRNFLSFSGALSSLSHKQLMTKSTHLHFYIYKFCKPNSIYYRRNKMMPSTKSLVVKEAILQLYYNFIQLFLKPIVIFPTLKSTKIPNMIYFTLPSYTHTV